MYEQQHSTVQRAEIERLSVSLLDTGRLLYLLGEFASHLVIGLRARRASHMVCMLLQVVKGEGMPISKQPGSKGDLRISFDIVFPKSLSDQQKQTLKQSLPAS